MRLNDIPAVSGPLDGTERMLGLKAGAAVLLSRDVATPQVTGLDPAKLPYAARGLARVRSGEGRMTINVIGHSAIMGKGGGTGGANSDGACAFCPPAALARALTASGLPARTSSWFGAQGITGGLSFLEPYDPRQSHAGAARLPPSGPGALTVAGLMTNLGDVAAKKSFLPAETWDTADVYVATYGGGGTMTLDVGGSTLNTFSTNAASALAKRTINPAAAVQTLNMTCTVKGGTGVYLVGAELYNSGTPDISVRNLGWDAAQASDFILAANPWNALPVLAAIPADLTIVCLMRNDQAAHTDPATVSANLQTLITTAKAGGDVMLCIDHEPNPNNWLGTSTLYDDDAYTGMLRTLAATNAIPLLDIPNRIGHWSQAAALGLFSNDSVHYGKTGWQALGSFMASTIRRLE